MVVLLNNSNNFISHNQYNKSNELYKNTKVW